MILDRLDLSAAQFALGTGWVMKAEGMCKDDLCVPLGDAASNRFSLADVAERLGMPMVHDARYGLWSLGPETVSGRALTTAHAPELVLPQIDGAPFHLSSLRGRKVVLVAWAPY